MSTIFNRRVIVNDPTRFDGNGISYKAKLIGIEDVKEARGDLMCQEALARLKNSVKISGQHKKKIFVNVTLEGLKIIDAISLASNQNKKKNEPKSPKPSDANETTEQKQDVIVLHTHPVHRISFISRDTTDTRAFGYVFGTEDGLHKFFAIKTATAAEHLVLSLRDLFQVVYEMKKKEMEAAKEKLDQEKEQPTVVEKENLQASGPGSTSGNIQTPVQKVNAETENIYQVPTNNAPVQPETHAEQVANLLDLEDQAEHILKGIEQIKNLEFDSVTNDTFSSPTSSTSPLAKLASMSSVGFNDDTWGLHANSSQAPSGLQAGQFSTLTQQPFQTSFPMQMQTGSGMNVMNPGVQFSKDPFGNDPFGSSAQSTRFPTSPPFGIRPGFNQPYGVQSMPRLNMMGGHGMMPGMVQHRMMSPPVVGGMHNPYGFQQSQGFQVANPFENESANILQPMKKDSGPDLSAGNHEPTKTPTKTREDLFGDLLEIKKSGSSTAISPKDLFAQMNAHDRKPMNEMIGVGKATKTYQPQVSQNKQVQASGEISDPFGDLDSVNLDKTRGLLLSTSGEDPFDTSHIPHVLTESLPSHANTIKPDIACATPPPVPSRQSFNYNTNTTNSSHNTTSLNMQSPPPLTSPPSSTLLTKSSSPTLCRLMTETTRDINENINSSPTFHYHLVHGSETSITLPPPDEPPPLLPAHLAIHTSSCPPPSPSTPRPNVKFAQKLSNINCKEQDSFEPEVISKVNIVNIITNVAGPSQNTNFSFKDVDISLKSQNSDSLGVSADNKCDTRSTDDFQLSKRSTLSHSSSLKEMSCSHDESCSYQSIDSDSNKTKWVDFENKLESHSSASFSTLSANKDDNDDPFNLPLHLAPGFKAVAKFGSDPFDESTSEPFSNEVWQPFSTSPHDSNEANADISSPVSSPFGDAFVAPAQQVTNKSLFD